MVATPTTSRPNALATGPLAFSPNKAPSFIAASRNRATSGSNTPLNACAARIAGVGRMSASPNPTPMIRMTSHTERKRHPDACHRASSGAPNRPRAVSAAASGAVTADETPAASRPIPKPVRAQPPSSTARTSPSASNENSPVSDVPTTRMPAVISRPKPTATASPKRISFNPCPRAKAAPRKRLYGTTVVPTKASTPSKATLSSPKPGVGTSPAKSDASGGASEIATARNPAPMSATKIAIVRATPCGDPESRRAAAIAARMSVTASLDQGNASIAPAAPPSILPAS